MSITPAIARELVNGARDVLRQGAAVATGNQGEYIKSGQPQSIYGRMQQGAARQACRRYADQPGRYSGAAAVLVEGACRPYLDDIGYGDGPEAKVPFQGGQCPGVNYGVTITRTTGATFGNTLFARGPITELSVTQVGTFTYRIRISGFTQSGQPFSDFADRGVLAGEGAPTAALRRVDGQPDNCGRPDPVIRPPVPPPVPGPPKERFNPSPDVDIDIGVEINIDGSIDIDFGTGPITVDPFGDDDGVGGGSGGGGLPPGDIGSPGSPVDVGPSGDESGEAPPGQVLTALQVNIVQADGAARQYAPGVYRGVCYVYMGTSEGLDHDPAGAMMRSGQLVLAEKENLTHWRVSANSSYSIRVTPYYREVPEDS